MPRGDGVDRVHVGALAVQAHRHDGPRARRDRRLDRGWRRDCRCRARCRRIPARAEQHDHLAGGDEGERGGDDLVAAARCRAPSWQSAAPRCRWRRAMQCRAPCSTPAACSSSATSGPMMYWPWSSTRWMRASMRSLQRRVLGLQIDELHPLPLNGLGGRRHRSVDSGPRCGTRGTPSPASGRASRSPWRLIQPIWRAGTPTISAKAGTSRLTTRRRR